MKDKLLGLLIIMGYLFMIGGFLYMIGSGLGYPLGTY